MRRTMFCMTIAFFAYVMTYAVILVPFSALMLLLASLGGVFENAFYSLTPLVGFLMNLAGSYVGMFVAALAIGRFSSYDSEETRYKRLFIYVVVVLLAAINIYAVVSGATILPTFAGLLPPLYHFIMVRKDRKMFKEYSELEKEYQRQKAEKGR